MKPLALLLALLALCQCEAMRGHRDAPVADPPQVEKRWEGRELERAAFADGQADGAADLASGSAKDYARHQGRFSSGTEQAYREGYNEGYAAGGASAALTAAQQQAHDTGYAAGVRDRRMGRGADPDQHAGTYDAKLGSWFLDGYNEGFEGR